MHDHHGRRRAQPPAGAALSGGSEKSAPGRRRSRFVTLANALLLAAAWLLAASWTSAEAANRYAALALDANTGQILYADAADEPRYPASLTKMMTLYLVFERLEEGRLKPDTPIAISEHAADTPPSKLGLEAGSTIALADAVKALITKSANDIAVAIAEHLAGSEAAFAELMTTRARQLGLKSTIFRNPHGLPNPDQTTTARDMVMLGMRLYDHFPAMARLFAMRAFTYRGRTHRNHNTMLQNYAGMDGLKTGYTRQSGFNLVASVHRDGRHVIAAVLGGSSAAARNARMRVLLDHSLARASRERTRQPEPAPFRAKARVAASPRPSGSQAGRAAPRLVEPVRAAKRPYMAEAAPAAAHGWRSTVRMAAAPGTTSTAGALGLTPRSTEPPAPAARAGVVQVTSVRTVPIAPRAAAAPAESSARRPSTLQAQAGLLANAPAPAGRTDLVRASAPARAVPAPQAAAAPASGRMEIQIGAYSAEAEARQRLEAVRQRSGFLAGARMATPAVNVGGKRLYRARFTGLDVATAAKACNELRRLQVDCLVAKAD